MPRDRKGKLPIKPDSRSNDVWKTSPDTIRQFLEQRPDYEELCTEVAYILSKRLKEKDIEIATVTWRAKTLKSFGKDREERIRGTISGDHGFCWCAYCLPVRY